MRASPGLAPSTYTGPASGYSFSQSRRGRSLAFVVFLIPQLQTSFISKVTESPSWTLSTGLCSRFHL